MNFLLSLVVIYNWKVTPDSKQKGAAMRKQTAPWMVLISIIVLLSIFSVRLFGGQIEIVRDSWGIAHIYADNDLELFFGAGYATAEDRMFQMELSRRKVAGTLSEIYGKDLLESDKLLRVFVETKCAHEFVGLEQILAVNLG